IRRGRSAYCRGRPDAQSKRGGGEEGESKRSAQASHGVSGVLPEPFERGEGPHFAGYLLYGLGGGFIVCMLSRAFACSAARGPLALANSTRASSVFPARCRAMPSLKWPCESFGMRRVTSRYISIALLHSRWRS